MVLPGYSAHFEVNYSDRLPATVRLGDGRFMTVVREAPLLAQTPKVEITNECNGTHGTARRVQARQSDARPLLAAGGARRHTSRSS